MAYLKQHWPVLITVELQDIIEKKIAEIKALPSLGVTSEDLSFEQGGLKALEWVLEEAHLRITSPQGDGDQG